MVANNCAQFDTVQEAADALDFYRDVRPQLGVPTVSKVVSMVEISR
jgi:hypothetical protein